jgi:hypothetical protein
MTMGLSIRKLVEETIHSPVPGDLIQACAEHFVRLKDKGFDADAETILEWVWRDFADNELKGIAIPGGKFRRYVLDDIFDAMADPRYKALIRHAQERLDDERAENERREAEEAAERERVADDVARERELVPHLYGLIEELQVELAELRGRPLVRSGSYVEALRR